MKRPEDLLVHEFIHLTVDVQESPDPGLTGLHGRIVDETKNTFVVERSDDRSRIIIQKARNLFKFKIENDTVLIKGDDIIVRPQDRIKKLYHKRKQIVNDQ